MRTLALRLHDEHKTILEMLKGVRTICPKSDEGIQKLIAAKQFILDHLALEDAELYPALRRHGSTMKLADKYSTDMADLAPRPARLFRKV